MKTTSLLGCWLALATVLPHVQAETAPHAAAAQALLGRLLPQHVGRFAFETIPPDQGRDVFEIESLGPRVVVRGNNGVSMAMGLNWYLKHYAHCHVSWYGNQLHLPDPPPAVPAKVRQVSWARCRYFLNYCCFGYSLPWWDWAQWEQLIDWMALNGVNMPLSVTGQEAVWQAVCRRLGMSEGEITAFLAGPPYLPFQWMGCLDGHGGPLPQSWIARHEALGKQILARQREFGMTPVLQGFTGHVPAAVAQRFPAAKLHSIRWIEWTTQLLDPLDPAFAQIAKLVLQEQSRRFGSDHLYAADTFIEMVPPNGELKYLADLSGAIYDGLAKSDPQAVWVLQGWAFMFQPKFWTQPRIRAFLDAIPNDRMVILDLFCENQPMWDHTEAFYGKPWLWCNVQSFGRAVHLGGALDRNNRGLYEARGNPKSGRLAGLGFVNEGLDYNPIAFDLMFEMAWRDAPVDLAAWVAGYARHRYGRSNTDAEAAWAILRETVYAAPCRTRSIIDQMPTLRSAQPVPYSNVQLAEAWRRLLLAAAELGKEDTYRFDLVNLARQVLSNHAAALQRDVTRAYRANDRVRFAAATQRYLQLIGDLDELLATRREFLLGTWLEDAKRWGSTDVERARLEWNARRGLTLWGTTPALRDYARKEWAGMLAGFYGKRWESYLQKLSAAMESGRAFDEKAVAQQLFEWEQAWADQQETYPVEPKGDSLALAKRLWNTYGEAVKTEPAPLPGVSLTTGKPVTCSSALPQHAASLANDGARSDTNRCWATDVGRDPAAWWQVDLEKPTTVGRVVVVCYYGDDRSYGFTVEVSNDSRHWEMAADRRHNKEPSTEDGYTCTFTPRGIRYLRITQTANSANTGRHLVEVLAFEK